MSGRSAAVLLARYGRAFLPSTARRGIVNSRITSLTGFRTYSDEGNSQKQTDDILEFPKPPLSPVKHFMQCAKSFRAFSEGAQELALDVQAVEQLNKATKEVLEFVTERLSVDDFEAVSDRITSTCLNKVRSMVSSLSDNDKKLLHADSNRPSIIDHHYPWFCRGLYFDGRKNMEITFCSVQILLNGTQIVWGISLLMPEYGGSSDEWKVNRLHFDLSKTS